MTPNGKSKKGGAVPIDREQRVLGILLVSLGLLVAIGLIQHNTETISDARRFNRLISRALLGFLGFGAWLIPILLVRIGWNRLVNSTIRSMGKSVLLFVTVLLVFSLLAFAVPELFTDANAENLLAAGGRLGATLFEHADRYFGALGAMLIGITFLLVILVALYDIAVPRLSLPFDPGLLRPIPGRVGGLFRRWGAFLLARSLALRDWTVGKWRTVFFETVRARAEEATAEAPASEEEYEEYEEEEDVESDEEEPEGFTLVEEEETDGNGIEEEDGSGPQIVMPEKAKPARISTPKKRKARGEKEYLFPPITMLRDPPADAPVVEESYLRSQSARLEEALTHFGVKARVIEVHPGPVITRFELEPAPGVKVQQVANLADDLALALRAKRIRIVAPIPGKGAIGVEIPNPEPRTVYLKELLTSAEYADRTSTLSVGLGKDISGKPFITSLEAMPHLLIAGATGAGKSVNIHTILTNLLYGAAPEEVHLILIDPKMLEMTIYNGIPHLITPVVTNAKDASRVLRWAVFEMERRYKLLARVGVRNILDYNGNLDKLRASRDIQDEGIQLDPLPYLVIVIDEFADLILTAPNEIENPVARLAQMARAVGIHLVLATQRPSVNVITGVIKANFPSRIAFQVASKIDSRTIIDANGAEKLLGCGDMLFVFSGRPEVNRIHGAFISTEETTEIVTFLKEQGYQPKDKRTVLLDEEGCGGGGDGSGPDIDLEDELFDEAARIVIRSGQGSVSLLQRRLRVGYSRAARIVDLLEDAGVVGPFEGSKAREVLVDEEWLRVREEGSDMCGLGDETLE